MDGIYYHDGKGRLKIPIIFNRERDKMERKKAQTIKLSFICQ